MAVIVTDVTRVLVLEETQAGPMSEIVASLIKSIGQEEGVAQFSVSFASMLVL